MTTHRVVAYRPEFASTPGADFDMQYGEVLTIYFNGNYTTEPAGGSGQFPHLGTDRTTIKIIQGGSYGFNVSIYADLTCNTNAEFVSLKLTAQHALNGGVFTDWISKTEARKTNVDGTLYDFSTTIAEQAQLQPNDKVRFKLEWAGTEPTTWGSAYCRTARQDLLLRLSYSPNEGRVLFSGACGAQSAGGSAKAAKVPKT